MLTGAEAGGGGGRVVGAAGGRSASRGGATQEGEGGKRGYMTAPPSSDNGSAGLGIDAYGGQTVDPTENVKALVIAEARRLDEKIDIEGKVLQETPFPINPAGFVIHSAVHAARHDVQCVMHTHTLNGVAVSAQKGGLLPISQFSIFVLASLGYHDYEGLALRDEEKPRLVADLGNKYFLMLRNHGLLTVGPTVAAALGPRPAGSARFNGGAILAPQNAGLVAGGAATPDWPARLVRQFALTYSAFDVGHEVGPFYPPGQPILPLLWAVLWLLGGTVRFVGSPPAGGAVRAGRHSKYETPL